MLFYLVFQLLPNGMTVPDVTPHLVNLSMQQWIQYHMINY